MVKLPDSTIIGSVGLSPNRGSSELQSNRGIARIDASPIAKGQEDYGRAFSQGGQAIANADAAGAAAIAGGEAAFGKGVQNFGSGLVSVAGEAIKEQNALEETAATSSKLIKDKQLLDDISKETDPNGLEEKYKPQFTKSFDESAAMISDPQKREMWAMKHAPDLESKYIATGDKAYELRKSGTIADASDRVDALRQSALTTDNPVLQNQYRESAEAELATLKQAGYIDAVQEQKARKAWVQSYTVGALEKLAPQDRLTALGGYQGALKQQESSGNPGKVNQLGYAGLYQFGAPRLAAMGVYTPGPNESMDDWSKTPAGAPGKWSGTFNIPGRPDIKTIKDFLASPAAQEEAFQLHSGKMDQEIAANGFDKYIGKTIGGTEITREGLHAMMHLGGVGGVKRTLESGGKDSPVDANGTSVLSYARFGNQSGISKVASLLPEDTRVQMARTAQNEIDRSTVKDAAAQSEVYDRAITDASAGIGTLPKRAAIEQDPKLTEPIRNTLLKQYDSAAGDVAKFERAMTKFRDPNAGSFNPYDKDDRENSDKIFKALGGDEAALQSVVQRTGVIPKSAVVGMRGGLSSAKPDAVQASLQLAANLVGGDKPDAFAGIDGGKELSDAGLAFRHYVYDRGMTAADATKKYMEEQTPEYQQKIKARIKSEDVNAIVKKELKDSDIRSAFDPSFLGLAPNPQLTFNPEMRQRTMGDYEEIFRENFAKTGDVSLSKTLATEEMKKTWGVTNVNGSKVVMKYPPERSPVYAGIDNPSEHIAAQAVAAIKEWNGVHTSNLPAAETALKLNPQEKNLYELHTANLLGAGGINNPDGTRSTLKATTVESDGKTYLIPTVYGGKTVSNDEAWQKAKTHLQDFPAYNSEAEAKARYDKIHTFMEKDTKQYQDSGIDRSKIRLDEVKNTGERFVRGLPPTYVLSYTDKNGHVQTIPKQFYADPVVMKADQTARRGAAAQAIMDRQSSFEQDLAAQNAVLN